MNEPILQLFAMGALVLAVAFLMTSESAMYESLAAVAIMGAGYAIGRLNPPFS